MAGIDTAGGLARVGGNPEKYLDLLRQFVTNHGKDIDRIRAMRSEGKQRETVREAHTLEGVASLLGADALARVSARLEKALATAPAEVDNLLVQADLELSVLLASLNGLPELGPGPAARPLESVSSAELVACCVPCLTCWPLRMCKVRHFGASMPRNCAPVWLADSNRSGN